MFRRWILSMKTTCRRIISLCFGQSPARRGGCRPGADKPAASRPAPGSQGSGSDESPLLMIINIPLYLLYYALYHSYLAFQAKNKTIFQFVIGTKFCISSELDTTPLLKGQCHQRRVGI